MPRGSFVLKSFIAASALGFSLVSVAARASDGPADEKLSTIEREIKRLQKELAELKGPETSAKTTPEKSPVEKPADKPSTDKPASSKTASDTATSDKTTAKTATTQAANNSTTSAEAPVRTGFRGRGQRDTTDPVIIKIRDEGLNHSQVYSTLDYLCNVIGHRLTGSPNAKRANDWTRGKLEGWGLTSAHLEPWGPFGRGWELKRFSLQVVKPQDIPLIACPKAWTPGFDKPFEANVVWIDAKTDADLDKYKGKLKGAVVLTGGVRPLKPHFDAPGVRMTEADLLAYANSTGRRVPPAVPPPKGTPSTEFSLAQILSAAKEATATATSTGNNTPRTGPSDGATTGGDPSKSEAENAAQQAAAQAARRGESPTARRMLNFCQKEGAALVLTSSPQGDGGTLFVASASVPGDIRAGEQRGGRGGPKPWSEDAPAMPAQVCVAVEDYNRLVRMIQQGEELKMAVEMQVELTPTQPANNTIAEIPGDDLKDEVVMLGGHLDSWHSGTGATDNGAGVAVAMEAVRILKAAGVKPRRTIRIGLWTGEEQGLLGSRAYVTQHFGTAPEATRGRFGGRDGAADSTTASPQSADVKPGDPKPADTKPADAKPADAKPADSKNAIVRLPEHDKLSVYFNLDNGTGRIRGIFTQGNEAAVPLFRKWLTPFHDLGADTVSLGNTGSTDHISFEAVTLPGFEFMQDPIEYMSRTHHSNQDVFDRIPEDDLKQAATIMAAFVYDAAMLDQRFPRKSANE